MHFILIRGELLLGGIFTSAFYKLFMALSQAFHLLFLPRGVTEADTKTIDDGLKFSVANCYEKIYGGVAERLPLCLSTLGSLLDIVPLLHACSARAGNPGSSGIFRWKVNLGRWESLSAQIEDHMPHWLKP